MVAMQGDGVELPIFELPVVILPGELLPLHIFEERYKRMIGHCLENAEPFGIVFRDEGGNAHRIGCMARVTEVLERFEDGRMNVVVAGERPFKVLERFEAGDFPAGEVEPIEAGDEPEQEDPEAAGAAREAFAELVEQVSGESPDAGELEAERLLRHRGAGGAAAGDQAGAAGAALGARPDADAGRRAPEPGRRAGPLGRDRRAGEDERQGRNRVAAMVEWRSIEERNATVGAD